MMVIDKFIKEYIEFKIFDMLETNSLIYKDNFLFIKLNRLENYNYYFEAEFKVIGEVKEMEYKLEEECSINRVMKFKIDGYYDGYYTEVDKYNIIEQKVQLFIDL